MLADLLFCFAHMTCLVHLILMLHDTLKRYYIIINILSNLEAVICWRKCGIVFYLFFCDFQKSLLDYFFSTREEVFFMAVRDRMQVSTNSIKEK